MSGGYVLYLLRCQDFLKFGITGEFERRMAAYKGHCPIEIEVIHVFNFENRSLARKPEMAIHKHFRDEGREFRFDWFLGVSNEHAIEVSTRIVEDLMGQGHEPMGGQRDRMRKNTKSRKADSLLATTDEDVARREYVERVLPSVLTASLARWLRVSVNKARDIAKGRVYMDHGMINTVYEHLTSYQQLED